MCTSCMRCFSTRAFATEERREIRLNTLFHSSLMALGLTSVTIHPFPSSKHPRRPADSTDQPVLSVVHPSTLGSGERIDRRWLIGIRVEFVRRKAFEQTLCGRRAVFIRRGGARSEWRRWAKLGRYCLARFCGCPCEDCGEMRGLGKIRCFSAAKGRPVSFGK
jgi:hypothetical protein